MADQMTLAQMARSPLAALTDRLAAGAVGGARAVRVAELPVGAMFSLRVAPGSAAATGIEEVLGTSLPDACGEVAAQGAHSVLWLGPDEWLIVSETPADELAPVLLEAARGGGTSSLVDVSANRAIVELTGPAARAVLEKGCPADLHPRAFGPGRAITTTLARIPVLLWQTGDQTYRVLPRSSFAGYVASWLLDAMQEFASDFRDGGSS